MQTVFTCSFSIPLRNPPGANKPTHVCRLNARVSELAGALADAQSAAAHLQQQLDAQAELHSRECKVSARVTFVSPEPSTRACQRMLRQRSRPAAPPEIARA